MRGILAGPSREPLCTAEQRRRRDASRWTLVQGILAPLQFLVFLVSLWLVLRFLLTGEGLLAATVSVVVKTAVLYLIMVTGSLWEHDVFGRYLFARSFFWEDVVSMLVLALHTAYLAALATDGGAGREEDPHVPGALPPGLQDREHPQVARRGARCTGSSSTCRSSRSSRSRCSPEPGSGPSTR